MKKITLLLISILMVASIGVQAQKTFAGTMKSKNRIEGTTDPNLIAKYEKEQEKTVFGNKSKTVVSQSGIGFIIILDGDKNTATTVVDVASVGFGKYYRTDTMNHELSQFDYTTDKNDTKTIAGYKCYKVVCTITDLETDETKDITLYVTDDLVSNYKAVQYPGLTAFPLYTAINIEDDGKTLTVVEEVVEIKPSKKIKNLDFLLPDGVVPFTEAPDQLKQLFGM